MAFDRPEGLSLIHIWHEHIAAYLAAPGYLFLHAFNIAYFVQMLALFYLVQLCGQHLHAHVAVLELAALVLAAQHNARGLSLIHI